MSHISCTKKKKNVRKVQCGSSMSERRGGGVAKTPTQKNSGTNTAIPKSLAPTQRRSATNAQSAVLDNTQESNVQDVAVSKVGSNTTVKNNQGTQRLSNRSTVRLSQSQQLNDGPQEPEFLPSDQDDDTMRCVKSIRRN